MTDTRLQELFAHATSRLGATPTPKLAFIARYFEGADPDVMGQCSAEHLYALACAHWRLLEPARAGTTTVRVFNPVMDEDGFLGEHTLVQVVHDDMPFLVDSVTMALNRAGLSVHWIVHPLLRVTRDASGGVADVEAASADRPSGLGEAVTSCMLFECDRLVDAKARERLRQDVEAVLADVRLAVDDWRAMLSRVAECEAASVHAVDVSAESRSEGVALLRWLQDGHFTFLGARDYRLQEDGQHASLVPEPDSGLGILRGTPRSQRTELPNDAIAMLHEDSLLLVTKAMSRSTVHRPAWLDYIGVKRFDASGKLWGETRFLGLHTSTAYSASILSVPVLRQRASLVLKNAGVVPESHAAKTLLTILENYPRDELFQTDAATLTEHALGIMRLQERQRTRIFVRRDPFGRFTSVQVYLPRERFNTELRIRVGKELLTTLRGDGLEFTPWLTESPMARIHYIVLAKAEAPAGVRLAELQSRVERLSERWEDGCAQEILRSLGEAAGLPLVQRFSDAFPTAYREDFSAAEASEDSQTLASLGTSQALTVRLYRPLEAEPRVLRLKIFGLQKITLSDSLPLLESMGVRVLDEHPYRINPPDGSAALWIHDIGLEFGTSVELGELKARFEELFVLAWRRQIECDALNRLVTTTGLDAQSIAVLRAYTRYFRQIGFAYSQGYLEETLNRHPRSAWDMFRLFTLRFDPAADGDRASQLSKLEAELEHTLASVESLEEDRVLRQFIATIRATVRTNFWQRHADGQVKPYLSLKLDSRAVPGIPEPRPLFEIWVYSPRVEGIHLRSGKVARGGLRWSDRREDFRTEVLGLVKAQQVKNTVIVPVGSKGGFVLKAPPDAKDREAYQAEGVACYQTFLRGLLDLTDNIVHGQVVPPQQVVRHDADDPYLVVAADKGTASFSDIANAVSAEYGFWLGDAFASGGSVGYDHKKMGITARGAWESVKRHFRGIGLDTQKQAFTVVGVGDMSGDVFGNGMLLSPQIRLVAAFDHRHIFLDPQPDPAKTLQERTRLFGMPRSSWDDFDRACISEGGGVYPRQAKSIPLSAAVRRVLAIEAESLSPQELMRAILMAPVDLFYNGGIGTYVKATSETHAQVGDKSNDGIRVNGSELRCKVVVEGGNLGCTQNGRIEYAHQGGLIYTDAIDNSAGVDCSDHEVNIKILLGRVVEAGDITLKQRNELLASMTDDVAHLVLQDNYYQTQALDVATFRGRDILDGQTRLMHAMEQQGRLSRTIEFLPSDDELARRRAAGLGLTAPENAVLLAYAKMAIYDELLASDLPDDLHFTKVLTAYFPEALRTRFAAEMLEHPLRREIVATHMANTVLNRAGATFVSFLAAKTGCSAADAVRAFTLAREIFDLESIWDRIDALDYAVETRVQLELLTLMTTMTQRAARWMLRLRAQAADLPSLMQRYQPVARALRSHLAEWSPEAQCSRWRERAAAIAGQGVDATLAEGIAALTYTFPALDLADVAQATGGDLDIVARLYFGVDEALNLTSWRSYINRLPTDTMWQSQARTSARDDVYAVAAAVTRNLLMKGQSLQDWLSAQAGPVAHVQAVLKEVSGQTPDLAAVTVALRELRQLT